MKLIDSLYHCWAWAPTVMLVLIVAVYAVLWRRYRFAKVFRQDLFSPDAPVMEPMLFVVGLGLLMGLLLMSATRSACVGRAFGVCLVIQQAPPWLILTGVVAAPPVLLTWYWSAAHKQLDIKKGQQDVEKGRADLRLARRAQLVAIHKLRKDAELIREGQITDRFIKAIGLIGSEKASVRIGGIYALERIYFDSPRDQWSIVETLAAFVRQTQPRDPTDEGARQAANPVTADAQSALTVLGRLRWTEDQKRRIDVHGTRLTGANLIAAYLDGAAMFEIQANGADFRAASLRNTDMHGSAFSDADFRGATLVGVNLGKSNLVKATLTEVDMAEAVLDEATLQHANFSNAKLTKASIIKAELEYAWFIEADLRGAIILSRADGADFSNARLEGANLQGIGSDTTGVFTGATYDDTTRFPQKWNHAARQMKKV